MTYGGHGSGHGAGLPSAVANAGQGCGHGRLFPVAGSYCRHVGGGHAGAACSAALLVVPDLQGGGGHEPSAGEAGWAQGGGHALAESAEPV
jgi:hypothetical protein